MVNASVAEIYFIAAMFLLIVVISGTATYFFFRTYRKEQTQKRIRLEKQKSDAEK